MIEVIEVTKSYGTVEALAGLSLTVEPGAALGLVGANGAGKSTLIRILCGLSRPDSGTARINGHDLIRQPVEARRALGCLPEHPPLFDLLTGGEQLLWVGRAYGLSDALLVERIEELGERLDISDALSRRIGEYSKGMRQKLAFVAAVVHDPKVIILDEPFEGVDVMAVDAMKAILKQFMDHGAVVLLSSHILSLVEDVCSQFTVMSKGRAVFQGNRQSLALEAGKLTTGTAGRQLESVFLDRVAPNRVASRLKTVAGGRS